MTDYHGQSLKSEQKKGKVVVALGVIIGFLVGVGVVMLAVFVSGSTFGLWPAAGSVLLGSLFAYFGWLIAGMVATGDGPY